MRIFLAPLDFFSAVASPKILRTRFTTLAGAGSLLLLMGAAPKKMARVSLGGQKPMSSAYTAVVAVLSSGILTGISKWDLSLHSFDFVSIGRIPSIAFAHCVSKNTASRMTFSLIVLIFVGMAGLRPHSSAGRVMVRGLLKKPELAVFFLLLLLPVGHYAHLNIFFRDLAEKR
jgi:hypothetical protein